jgi:hypothetical protein
MGDQIVITMSVAVCLSSPTLAALARRMPCFYFVLQVAPSMSSSESWGSDGDADAAAAPAAVSGSEEGWSDEDCVCITDTLNELELTIRQNVSVG